MGYDGLRKHGVRIIHETATAIEPDQKRVRLGEGYLQYDRLVVSPGVDFQLEQVEGLAQNQDKVLHAWKAGPQTVQLAQQLAAMPDGGVFVLSIPLAAYRCPPGPYERTSMVAWYLKTNKPKSKLIVLDANPNIISKAALFRAAWQAYPNIDYRGASRVVGVDPGNKEVRTEFDKIRYDVVNVIPPQRAGAIAVQADLVGGDKRWCEVNHVTYESVKQPGIHVIGDATIGLPVPKSGNVANAMGKITAASVVSLINGKEPPITRARQYLLQLGERPGGHRGGERVPHRERQGRADRAEAHAGAEPARGPAGHRLDPVHLGGHPGMSAMRLTPRWHRPRRRARPRRAGRQRRSRRGPARRARRAQVGHLRGLPRAGGQQPLGARCRSSRARTRRI